MRSGSLTAPSSPPPRPARPRRILTDPERAYLAALVDARERSPAATHPAIERQALESAGYALSDLSHAQIRSLAREITRKIDRALDIESGLIEFGLGKLAWIQLIGQMAQAVRWLPHTGIEVPDWKYRAVALKLWGLALGVFSAQPQGQGASIVIGAQVAGDQAQVAAQVQWPQRQPAPATWEEEPVREPPPADAEAHWRAQRLALAGQPPQGHPVDPA